MTSHPLAWTWQQLYCLLTTGPLVAFDSLKINFVYVCLHLTHNVHVFWSNRCMSFSLLDDCQPCLQKVKLYDMCHQTLSFYETLHQALYAFLLLPLIHWPPCASGHLPPRPFLRDPNQAQKRAKCMYRIKGSNPVLVMLQKRHLTEDTRHVLGV